ncbi:MULTISPECIES: endospore germination permease [unclassified Paenibacillus]|uniref:GerAB/ArcD/ProY family transporter n=1 Tax=unclassified Paenibacillus TaxID=185978 RepID=UPI0010EF734C|nr:MULTISPECIES: endospore germination permease [unclassified Paenibacillus]NIK68225.1 spore germination protein KB [Paenibacillus sp. BK720]TCM99560.1 spore germination protein KB [Paenibacillus sp. BK033]
MSKITVYQLFAITFIFQIGTTIIFGFGAQAGKDAWIGELISCFFGLVVVLIFLALMRMNPGLTLVQWFPAQFGRWIGTPIAFLYPLLFIYIVGRITADIRDMVSTTILFNTPLIVISGVFIFIIAYCVYSGIERISRLGEMFLPIVLLLFCIEAVLLIGSNVMKFHNLLPVLEQGWAPVMKTVYPSGITQSFGETITLAMFWTETKEPNKVLRITILASLLSGIMVTLFDVMAISVFGDMFSGFLYPLYTLLSLISIGKFIENLQMFGVLYLLMTALLKSVVLMFAAVRGIQQLTNMKSYRVLVIPSCAISLILGLTMSKNIAEHIYRHHFEILVPYIWVPMYLVLPAILLLVNWLRQLMK